MKNYTTTNSSNPVYPHRTAVFSLAYLNTPHYHRQQPCFSCISYLTLHTTTASSRASLVCSSMTDPSTVSCFSQFSSAKIEFSSIFTILEYTKPSGSYNQTKPAAVLQYEGTQRWRRKATPDLMSCSISRPSAHLRLM